VQIDSNKKLEQYLNNEFHKLRQNGKIITPNSKYFGQIGSTSCEDIPYELQLATKLNSLKIIFQDLLTDEQLSNYMIVQSPKLYEYRLKMDFVCAYNPIYEPHSRFGQRKKGNFSWIVDMDECNLISDKWFKKIRQLYEFLNKKGIRNYDVKKQDGELKYIVSKIFDGEAMLIIITRTSDNKETIEEAAQLALKSGFKSIIWQINNTTSDVSFGDTIQYWGQNYINIQVSNISYKVGANTFFQNNIYTFKEILNFTGNYLEDKKDCTLYDLYCGVGTIGLLLASQVHNVVGFDIIKESIESAKENAINNNIKNAEFYTINLSQKEIIDSKFIPNLVQGSNNISIVDPPRTGLEENGVNEVLKINSNEIIYISCNPVTQAKDLKQLIKAGYKIIEIKGFDMFPHTNHMENVVVLKRT
jgi:23S rRNA (uracil-5-)-methyltransferase RumA